jgi:phage-related protein
MTAQGTDAATATTALRFLMASLAGPTKAAATEMEGLGVGESEIPGITASVSSELATLGLNTSSVANTLAHGGIQAALTQITDAIGKKFPAGSAEYEAALKAAVGGTRGMTAALELTGSSAATFTENIQKISGASADASGNVAGWSLVQQDFSQKLDEAKDSAEVLFEKVGTALIPTLEQLMGIIEKVINWLSQHKAVAEALAAVIAGVLVAAIGAWTVSLFAAGGALAFLLSPVTLIVAGIAALVIGIIYAYGHFKAFRDAIQDVVSFVTGTVVPFLKQAWDELSSDVAILVNDISSRWAEIQQIISFAIDFVRGYIELNVDTIEEIWSVFHATILRVLEAAWDQVELIFKTAFALIGEILDFFIDLFTGHWSAAWNDLLDILKTIFALIVGTIENTLSIVGNLLASLAGIVLRALGGLASGVVSVAEGIGKGIANGFIWGINAVISAWDWLVGMLKIPGFSVGPVHFGGLDLGASLQIGKVPYLQEGGVISGSPDGTLVVAGENNTDEVIGPLSDIADYAGGGAVASTSSTVVNVYATFPNAILPSNSAMQALVQMLSTQITQYLIASGVVVRQR